MRGAMPTDNGMRRAALLILALIALTATVSATAALGGAQSVPCQTHPAKTFSTRDTHIFQLDAAPITLDSFADAKGHVLRAGPGGFVVGQAPPGWGQDSWVNDTSNDSSTEIIFDPGHQNAYAASGHFGPRFPTEFTIRRYTAGIQVDGVANWLVMQEPVSNFTLAYANGQSLSSMRLCLDVGRNGSIDAALPPTGWIDRLSSVNDETPPRVSAHVLAADSTYATIEIDATDSGKAASGMAAIGWTIDGSTGGGYYTAPIRVPRDAKVVVWAMDRAGNLSSPEFDVAKLPTR
jgi:hypothetical protein